MLHVLVLQVTRLQITKFKVTILRIIVTNLGDAGHRVADYQIYLFTTKQL